MSDLGSIAADVSRWLVAIEGPGYGRISRASDPHVAPDGKSIAVTGIQVDDVSNGAVGVICVVDADSGRLAVASAGPRDRCARWSPTGDFLAYLSGGQEADDLLQVVRSGTPYSTLASASVPGVAEYLAWSPSGQQLLIGVADRGAELAGMDGSGTYRDASVARPSWAPQVWRGLGAQYWRRVHVYDVKAGRLAPVSAAQLTVWEACWASDDRIIAVASRDPTEEGWYDAELVEIDLARGRTAQLYATDVQIGLPSASPSGRWVAVIRALCSDRKNVAGELILIDSDGRGAARIDTGGVDVTFTTWLNAQALIVMGVRGLDVVAGEVDPTTGAFRETWVTPEACGPGYPEAAPAADGTIYTMRNSYSRYFELLAVKDGKPKQVVSFSHAGIDYLLERAGRIERISATAKDGVALDGLLVLPTSSPPHPLILHIHGGPVWAWLNRWNMGYAYTAFLAARGYALLHINPRGSGGRGQPFVQLARGDLGGMDALDLLAGVDAVLADGLVDPARIGVTGPSYGGFLTTWLITQDQRFAAAVAVSPVTDWVSQHHTSNVPFVDVHFLDGRPRARDGLYASRSPLTFADRVQTPLLQIVGELDRCTPASQAIAFHRALVELGSVSELALYPEEAHGVRMFAYPATLDYLSRMTLWFERYMGPTLRE